jgi:cell division protein FtsN
MTTGQHGAVQITRKGLLIWGLLVFFIAGWMFVLGILVGRGTAPVAVDMNRLEQELRDLKTTLLEKENAQLALESDERRTPADLGFYEALKKPGQARDFKMDPPPQVETVEALSPPPQPPAAPPADEPARKTVAQAPAPEARPRKDIGNVRSATRKEASADAVQGRFSVQVGAFKDADRAEQMAADLRGKGFPSCRIETPLQNGAALHRVRVGAFKDRGAAESMLAKLKSSNIKGLVVATQ